MSPSLKPSLALRPDVGAQICAPHPWNELVRQWYLQSLEVIALGTPQEPSKDLDDICQLCSAKLDMPIAGITVIDKDSCRFLAKRGVDINKVPRDISICPW